MTLAEWLAQKDMTQTEFAQRIGVGASAVSKLINGRTRPDWKTLDRIVAATGGAVTANDFHHSASQPAEEIAA